MTKTEEDQQVGQGQVILAEAWLSCLASFCAICKVSFLSFLSLPSLPGCALTAMAGSTSSDSSLALQHALTSLPLTYFGVEEDLFSF